MDFQEILDFGGSMDEDLSSHLRGTLLSTQDQESPLVLSQTSTPHPEDASIALVMGWMSIGALCIGWFTTCFSMQLVGAPEQIESLNSLARRVLYIAARVGLPNGGKYEVGLWQGLLKLLKEKDFAIAGFLFAFTFLFPAAKLAFVMQSLVNLGYLNTTHSKVLKFVGPWSMIDVFVVAVIVVAVKALPFGTVVRPSVGFFSFAISVILAWGCVLSSPSNQQNSRQQLPETLSHKG